MTLSEDLTWRGLIKDKTFANVSWLDHPKTFYCGIDATADSLTVGNLAILLLARRLIDAGWKAVLLIGGATSLIGDPGGKTKERKPIARQEVIQNADAIKKQISNLFANQPFELRDNYEWFSKIKFLDFLREYGKRFSMTELMDREFVRARIGEGGAGISYAEFSYGLAQGYDFLKLYQDEGVVLQIGGSDQWSNMLMGVAMIRKTINKEAHAMSMPLVVNKTTGQKFGKTEGGTIWLDSQKTSPTQFYQFWINCDDSDVESYLKIFTLLPKEQIEHLIDEHRIDAAQRKAQKALAEEITKLVHKEGKEAASNVTKYLTSQVSLSKATETELAAIRKEIPSLRVSLNSSLIEALVKSGLAKSNSDAKRLIASNAVYINGQTVNRGNFTLDDFQDGRLLLRRGKAYKDSALIELE
jgi:tyrosyl-tRNA synthetase